MKNKPLPQNKRKSLNGKAVKSEAKPKVRPFPKNKPEISGEKLLNNNVEREELKTSIQNVSQVRPTVVLDTCVLLADPDALLKFPSADIVLPLTVIEELDSKKVRLDEIGRAARSTSRLLESLRVKNHGTLVSPVPLANGGSLMVALNGLQLDILRDKGLKVNRNDNRIIAAALGLQEVGKSVELVSLDVNMRLKAASLGLVARDWNPQGGKNLEDKHSRVIQVESQLIEELYEQKSVTGTELPEEEFLENEHIVLKSGSQSVLVRYIEGYLKQVKTHHRPWGLEGRSKEQNFAIDLLLDREVPIVSLEGPAGTGKTILALAAALEQTFEPEAANYDRVMILRPVVAVGRQDIGFLPGDVSEKLGPWFEAVVDAMVALGDRVTYSEAKKTLEMWVQQGKLTMEAVTFLRGRSLQKTFIIVDEAQNLEGIVLKTILTRVGKGSKIVFLGDTTQIDNPYVGSESNSISILNSRFENQRLFGHVSLLKGERSEVANLAANLL